MFVPNKIQENPHLWETKLTPQRTVTEVICYTAHFGWSLELCGEFWGQEYLGLQAYMTVMVHGYARLGDSRVLSQCSFLSRGMPGCLNQKPTNVCRTPLFISVGDCSFVSQSGLTSSNLAIPQTATTKKIPNR